MPSPSDFRLYHSNALDVLAGLLAEQLRTPSAEPLLAPEVVLIPQVAMRRWLQATLAQAHGVAANLEFLTPGEFVRRALDANLGDGGEDLDAEALHWRLQAALADPATLREPALRPLRAYLRGDDPLKAWSLAGELAQVFEKYQAWRRDWLLDWEAGAAPDDAQAALWRRIAGGRVHRARRIDSYLARYADPAGPLPVGLPSRLFAFATLNVSPDVLRVIATQARVGVLHFYLPTPTAAYWGDLATLGERLRQGDAAAFGADENPLLEAWGGAGRDFMAVLGGYEVVHPSGDIPAYADPEARTDDAPANDSLLQRLQRDLLHRRPLPATPFRAQPEPRDPSLQVHACHTRLREVQVLHDRLRGLLEDPRFDPPLQPREIAVLAPDIDLYAPHVAAVFGGLRGHRDFIPYALADASPLAAEPLAEVFLRLLALPVSRFGLHEVLDLLATPAIAEPAGLDAAALERLRDWLAAAGARWGVDAAHRARHDAPADDACTWTFALDRLLLGHASGEDADIAGVAPWAELEGGALEALDALLRLLRVLARHERSLAVALAPAQWRDRLLALLDALLPRAPREPATARALERLRNAIAGFADGAARGGTDQPVAPEVVRAWFQAQLAAADTRAPLLTGGVSFGRMVPMRLLPFRVLCVLGMNDGEYPRRDPAGGLNRLAAELAGPARRRGDRSLREDDRFLFLQLLAAAGEVFYLSYLGADARDGSAREPSVLVSELLDVAARYHAEPDTARAALVLRHPLQPFAPEAFGCGDARRYSYRADWHAAAARTDDGRLPVPAWADAALPEREAACEPDDAPRLLRYQELRAFFRDPAAAFLRQRMALRLPEAAVAAEDTEPLVLPDAGLARYHLQHAVFEALAAGDACDSDALHAHLRARALLPSGPLGRRQLTALCAQVRPYAEAFARWRAGAPATLAFTFDLGDVELHGSLAGLYANGLARQRFGAPSGTSQIAHGLDWLVLSALGDARPLAQCIDGADGPGVYLHAPLDPFEARQRLRSLLALREDGLRAPLPFLPYSGWCWYEAQFHAAADARGNGKSPWEKAFERWHGERGFREGDAPAAQLALRGRDPFADAELGQRFRDIATQVFDAVLPPCEVAA